MPHVDEQVWIEARSGHEIHPFSAHCNLFFPTDRKEIAWRSLLRKKKNKKNQQKDTKLFLFNK